MGFLEGSGKVFVGVGLGSDGGARTVVSELRIRAQRRVVGPCVAGAVVKPRRVWQAAASRC